MSPHADPRDPPSGDDAPREIAPRRLQQSVGELVREHERMLHAFLLSRCKDEQEAREIAQEAYVRMLNLAQPGAISFMRAYLFKTATNIAADRARRRQVRERYSETVEEPVDELSPERHALGQEELDALRAALLELPPKTRRAFLLYRLEGWTVDEIGRHLGLQARMVWRHLSRAGVYCGLRVRGYSTEESKGVADAQD